jgi:hypothetical protein
MKIPHERQPLAKLARSAGWTITVAGNGHLRWTSPHGAQVFTSASPSTNRIRAYTRVKLRRAGLQV